MLRAAPARSCRVCLGRKREKLPAAPLQGPGSCCSAKLLIRQFLHLLWGLSPGVSSLLTPRPQEDLEGT